MHELGYVSRIWDDEVAVLNREDVEAIYGTDKTQEIYTKAQAHLEEKKDYFAEYPAQRLNVSGVEQKTALKQKELSEMLEEKAKTTNDISPLLALSLLASKGASSTTNGNEEEPQECCVM